MKYKFIKWVLITTTVVIILYFLFFKLLQKVLRGMAQDVIESFNTTKIHYWVDFGTLLGIIRENDIIWGDDDIDLCIYDNKETHKIMKTTVTTSLEKMGYFPGHSVTGRYVHKPVFKCCEIICGHQKLCHVILTIKVS